MATVFRLPKTLPNGFCFGGGYAVNFQMVDWFEVAPHPMTGQEMTPDVIRGFIREKRYYNPGDNYLVLVRDGTVFIVDVPA